jgi:excisionase family DNA binding protein
VNLRTLSISDAVAATGISRDTLYVLCESGQVKANRPSPKGRWRISEASLHEWIERTQPAAPASSTNGEASAFIKKFPEIAGEDRVFG